MKHYRFLAAALREFTQAAEWYTMRADLGDDFADVVERAIRRLRRAPQLGATWPGIDGVGRLILRRFPFVLIYTADAKEIVIVAVAHARRKPGYWMGRLRRRRPKKH